MSDDNKEKLIADLRAMDFSRSKPTAIGDEHGSRDRYGNLLLDPKIVSRVLKPIDSITITRGDGEMAWTPPRRLTNTFGPIDYTKMPPGEPEDNWREQEVRRIKETIKAHPDMGSLELYKLLMETWGYNVPYRVIRLPKIIQQDPEKD